MTHKRNRMLVWSGASALDQTTDLVVLATGFAEPSNNVKTGAMIQIAIMRADMAPNVALAAGLDQAICGNCPHRGVASGGTGGCYVQTWQGPRSTWQSHADHPERTMAFDLAAFAGRKIRFGSYGDPAAVPFAVWEAIAGAAAGHTGYTHQWRTCDPRFARYLMASVDSIDEARDAAKAGWRLFFARPLGLAKPGPIGGRSMVVCPASAEAGKRTVCASCMACGGTSTTRRSNITIEAHGPSKRAIRPLSLPLTVI